jgi:hypothetical protein
MNLTQKLIGILNTKFRRFDTLHGLSFSQSGERLTLILLA